ncbi:MAG TPA: hypothetical protein VHN79_03410 [Lacunisphaera sp.]|nr:hypothetical protein [Lacunisphaera sp.]
MFGSRMGCHAPAPSRTMQENRGGKAHGGPEHGVDEPGANERVDRSLPLGGGLGGQERQRVTSTMPNA